MFRVNRFIYQRVPLSKNNHPRIFDQLLIHPSAPKFSVNSAAEESEEPKSARWFSDFVSKDDLYRTSRRAALSMQHVHITLGGSIVMGYPQYIAGWFMIDGTSENKMDDELGVPLFQETSISGDIRRSRIQSASEQEHTYT